MTFSVALVNTAADNWQSAIDKLNTLANLASNAMVTVSTAPAGSVSTGNAQIVGSLSATVLSAGVLRGGNVETEAALAVSSNVAIGASIFLYTTGAANVTSLGVGANVYVNTSMLTVGNTTVNVQVNSSSVAIGGSNAATVAARDSVAVANTLVGTRGRINFIQGDDIFLSVTDDAAGGQVNVSITAVPQVISIPGGANTQIQFNDSNTLIGTDGLTFDKTSNNLTVSNTLYTQQLSLDGAVYVGRLTVNTSTTSAQLFDSWAGNTYRSGFYKVSIKNNSANAYMVAQLTLLFDGSDSHLVEFGTVTTNTAIGSFSANVNSGTVRLYYTPVSGAANSTLKSERTLITV